MQILKPDKRYLLTLNLWRMFLFIMSSSLHQIVDHPFNSAITLRAETSAALKCHCAVEKSDIQI